MTYDYDQHTVSGEQHLATAGELEDAGFTVHEAPRSDLDHLFDGAPDLETPEGCEQALRAIRSEIELTA